MNKREFLKSLSKQELHNLHTSLLSFYRRAVKELGHPARVTIRILNDPVVGTTALFIARVKGVPVRFNCRYYWWNDPLGVPFIIEAVLITPQNF